MVVFKCAIVGNPIVTKPAHGDPEWRLATNTDRVKWLIPPFYYDNSDDEKIVLKRKPNSPPTGNVGEVWFVAFQSQQEAVNALIGGHVHFIPSITDPRLVDRVRKEKLPTTPDDPPRNYNLHYLGFRTDLQPFQNHLARRDFVLALDLRAALISAGILTWRADGLLPGYPGDELYQSQAPIPLPTDLQEAINRIKPRLLCNAHDRIDRAIAEDIKRQQPSIQLCAKNGYRQLVEGVQSGEGHLFLYNWYIKEKNARRVLRPLFHSKSIPDTNLTRYDKADSEIDELLNDPPIAPRNALAKIYHDAPVFVLYHAHRTAAWRPNVKGLDNNLTDPECNPEDKLEKVIVE